MPAIAAQRMTAAEFMELPEDPHEIRRELVNGEIIVGSIPAYDHGRCFGKLFAMLSAHIEAHGLGELASDIDNTVSKFTVRRPDLFFFSTARLHLTSRQRVHGPPDLCVEFVSPSSVRADRVEKFAEYAAYGVMNYWIIDPAARTAEAFVLKDGAYALAAQGADEDVVHFPPFPELAIPLGKLWWSPTQRARE